MKISDNRVLADVADVLYIEANDVDQDADLRAQGMDSVRLMELVERWRSAGAEGIDFITLAEDQRVSRWLEVLAASTNDDAESSE
ncbi:acyl carrier protein [Parafrankia soli]|uniref:Acyl carrier protein n=1 Tax=Parafrankia soli TaxID=2599596 RepID=A0A1S1PEB0_9ACTN|nr:phosphopantetheine-binding protein [Parafrankia soli]ABW12474.1 phosphopantetheine-binding [Frankia sp. EAN1pec]OHV18902.1 acyl carrier protein [Parafrankia soli]